MSLPAELELKLTVQVSVVPLVEHVSPLSVPADGDGGRRLAGLVELVAAVGGRDREDPDLPGGEGHVALRLPAASGQRALGVVERAGNGL